MRLNEHQTAFFRTFGFLRFPGLFADDIEAITQEFEAVWQQRGGGHNNQLHDGERRSCLIAFIDQSERLSALMDDPRIVGIATDLLGEDFNYIGSDGNYYVGDTRWHSDGYWKDGPTFIKMAFYLDPLNADTGCLRVIPGSHHRGDRFAERLQEELRLSRQQELWGLRGQDIPAVPLETQPGDLLIFHHYIKHAAFGGSNRRRMFTLDVCQRYPASLLGDLRHYIGGNARFFVERFYGEAMVRTASPERMRRLEQVLANDGHLAELSRIERDKRAEPSRG